MCAELTHRGPDEGGLYRDPRVGLAHTRLSIIDLASGQQPLSNEDGTLWPVFNGEIFNYLELRLELIAHGHVFRTQSDTEVIVHAYEQWGRARSSASTVSGPLRRVTPRGDDALAQPRRRHVVLASQREGTRTGARVRRGGDAEAERERDRDRRRRLRGSIVRGILSSLSLLNRRKTPQEVFSSLRAAFVFLAQHREASRTPTLPIDELIAAYGRACGGESP